MRLLSTIVLSGLIFSHLSAQQLTNSGFESWTSGTPASWSTSHSCIPASGQETQDSSSVYQGSYDIKMVSGTLPSPASMPYPGFVHYGTATYDNSAQDFDLNGVAFPYRPDSLQFAYLYTPTGADSANAFCNFYSGNIGNIIGLIDYNFRASVNYKVVTVPIAWQNAQTSDSMNLTFYSGDILQPHTGSTLHIDAVKFIYNNAVVTPPNGIDNVSEVSLKIYPNPAFVQLHLTASDKVIGNTIRLYNVLGSEVNRHEIRDTHEVIDISGLLEGIYIYRIIDKNDKTVLTGKFTKE